VRLPVAPDSEAVKPEAPGKESSANKSFRILVVDDHEDTALGIARLLKSLGNVVASVHDGPKALEMAHTFRPDFVLLDIGLPGMDGYTVASALREDDVCKDAVIIAITGYGRDEDRRKSHAAGFDHHLIKPVNFESLIALIASTP
jgi:CheY-like chemotaxis protein